MGAHSIENVTLPVLPQPSKRNAVKLVMVAKYKHLLNTNKVEHIPFPTCISRKGRLGYGGKLTEAAHESPGILVSCWLTEKDGHPSHFTLCVAILKNQCARQGIGSQDRSICVGINFYSGN